jgi:undecaprenyl-diphosphatase
MFHLADLLKVIFLGIIEGLTEFIPVSSTAHLVITSHLIAFQAIKNNVFEIAIQAGAIFAILVIYRHKIFLVIFNLKDKNNLKFVANISLAFLPSVFIGLLLYKFIKVILFSNLIIAISLIIGGIIMILVHPQKADIDSIEKIGFKKSILIGIFQSLAMIPGISRSGATIISGLLLGLNRKTATEFSFFLAIPTIISAICYDLYKNYNQLNFENSQLIFLGMVSAFLSAILVIKWLINYVAGHNFMAFGIYRILLGVIILIFVI